MPYRTEHGSATRKYAALQPGNVCEKLKKSALIGAALSSLFRPRRFRVREPDTVKLVGYGLLPRESGGLGVSPQFTLLRSVVLGVQPQQGYLIVR